MTPDESKSRSSLLIYGALALAWLLVVVWLAVEHSRVAALGRQALLNRARDISGTIALVGRSGPPGFIRQTRLEAILAELVETTELVSVALLNAQGEVVATAGRPLALDHADLPERGVRWDRETLTVVNLVDFGQTDRPDAPPRPPTVVIPQSEEEDRERFQRERGDRPTTRTWPLFGDRPPPPPPPPPSSAPLDSDPDTSTAAPDISPAPPPEADAARDSRTPPGRDRGDHDRADREGRGGRRVFQRPFWMEPERYEAMLAKRGMHGFVFVISTEASRAELARDKWLRVVVAIAALAAALGLAVAWRGLVRSTRLRIRLVRAQEMNERLREMNLAAAGLAHEARNPLNIVRGLAQMIGRAPDIPAPVHEQLGRIAEEVDRVTQRLDEFIKYSRPPQPRLASTPVATVVNDVVAALQSDLEDKAIRETLRVADRKVLADESLLRQVVFNLVLNAAQAVEPGGQVAVSLDIEPTGEGVLRVDDDGPGVAPDQREAIFRPYVTTHENGSGLGLAVVRQIAMAHHWDIDCTDSDLGGASFRLRGLRLLDSEDETSA